MPKSGTHRSKHRLSPTRPPSIQPSRQPIPNRRAAFVFEFVEARVYLSVSPKKTTTTSASSSSYSYSALPYTVLKKNMATPEGYSTPTGAPLTPAKMRSAYGLGTVGSSNITFNGIQGDGTGQTIAIVGSGDYPTAAADLALFDTYWGLPAPPSFTKLNASGAASPLPATANAGEAALDIEWAHVMAPGASIVLLEGSLYTAMTTAKSMTGVAVVSISYNISGSQSDSFFYTPSGHTGVTFLAASGDSPSDVNEPGKSASVVSVGGTALTLSGSNYSSETTWSSAGGGLATSETQPTYQAVKAAPYSTKYRATPDVSIDADPSTGVAVYDTTDNATATPWSAIVGGTSLSTPLWAGLIAVVDQGRVSAGLTAMDGYTQTLPRLYTLPSSAFHDITTGAAANPAEPGYDLATGLGTPIANKLIPDLAGADTVTGQAFVDVNHDGVYDTGDTVLASKTVYLDYDGDGVQDSTEPTATTNSSGVFTFTDQLGGLSGTARLTATPTGDPYLTTKATFSTSYDTSQTVNLGYYSGNVGPAITTAAAASPNPVTAKTTTLTVAASDSSYAASNLTYTWAATTLPAETNAPTFSANATNAAASTVATFSKAGTYVFTVTATDPAGLTAMSSVTVTVSQTLTSLTITPGSANLTSGNTQQYAATQLDQFGNAMTSAATVTWSLSSGGGSITTAGLYTTPSTGTLAVVKATTSSITATTNVYVVSSPWTSVDVGGPSLAGNAYDAGSGYPSDTFTLNGAGSDVYGTTDQFHYVYQSLTGDGTIIARVASQTYTAQAAKAGVDIRASTATGAVHVSMELTAGKGPEFLYRTTTGGSTTSVLGSSSIKAPYYVKLVRSGDTFSGYVSSNGTTWTLISSATVAMTDPVLIGLMDASVDSTALGTDVFDHVSISPTVATAAASNPTTVTGKTAALSVLGSDTYGESTLSYTWSATTVPSGATAPTYSANGTNAAKNTTATFYAAGSYVFTVTITNAAGLTTASTVAVTVSQTLTAISVTPTSASVATSGTQQFTASGTDQFGSAMTVSPTWSVDSGSVGSVSSTGLYTAPATAGTATVRATSGSLTASATVTVIGAPALAAFTVNDGSAQRSMVNSLTLTFTQPVTLATGAITLIQRGNTTPINYTLTPSADRTAYTLTFTDSSFIGGSLADGIYDLTLAANSATNGVGLSNASASTESFFRLFGDGNGDGTVNSGDNLQFRSAFGESTGQSGYVWYFDYDANGTINSGDNLQFRNRFGTSLTT